MKQGLINKASLYKCIIIRQNIRCTLWRSDSTPGVTGNRLSITSVSLLLI